MRILLTNSMLDDRAGTELVVLDLARAFRARGHSPIAYSTKRKAQAQADAEDGGG